MGARVYRGPLRALEVGPIHNDSVSRAFHGSIGPAPRLQEPINRGSFLGPDCVAGTPLDYKAMLHML
ncbi:hypothetical protein ACRRTK_000714 [Alexandromys fortis]